MIEDLGGLLWGVHSEDVGETGRAAHPERFAPALEGDLTGDDQLIRSVFDEAVSEVASAHARTGLPGIRALEELVGHAVHRVEASRASASRRHHEIRRNYFVTGRSDEEKLLDESDVVRGTSNRYLTYFFQRRLALNPTVPLLPGEGTALERVFGRRINPRLTETNPAEADYILVPALEMAEAEEEVAAADAMLNSARIRLWVVQTVTFQLGIGLEAPVLRHVSTTRKLNGPDDGPTDVAVAEDLRSVVGPTWLATYFDREVAKPLVHAAAIVHFWHLFADQIRSEGDFHLIFDAAGFSLKPESALRRIREAFLSQKVCGDRSGGSDYKGDWPQFVECTRAFLRKNGVSLEAA